MQIFGDKTPLPEAEKEGYRFVGWRDVSEWSWKDNFVNKSDIFFLLNLSYKNYHPRICILIFYLSPQLLKPNLLQKVWEPGIN